MKSIVLVYDIPDSCFNCKYDRHDHLCGIALKNNDGNANKRPSWCPLKTLPKRKNTDYSDTYGFGWNDCLDKITGETK